MKTPDEDYFKKGASRMTDADFENVLRSEDEIRRKFESHGPLGRFIVDAKLLLSLVGEYRNKRYREIPTWSICAVVFSLLYVFSPIDFIPDFIPLVGFVDDAMIVAFCLSLVERDLKKYKEWKIKHG